MRSVVDRCHSARPTASRHARCGGSRARVGMRRREALVRLRIGRRQRPAETRAPPSSAAPMALTSARSPRITGRSRMSAWNCIRLSLRAGAAIGAELRSAAAPRSCSIAANTSATWNAMASIAARARCAGLVPSERPVTMPRASGAQCGAPSPTRAGTKVTPLLSGTVAASAASVGGVGDAEQLGHEGGGLARRPRCCPRAHRRRRPHVLQAMVRRQAVAARDALGGQRHQRRAGAVGRLHRARRADAVPEQRGVRVADHGVDRRASRERGDAGRDVAEVAVRGADLGQQRQRHAEDARRVPRPSAASRC